MSQSKCRGKQLTSRLLRAWVPGTGCVTPEFHERKIPKLLPSVKAKVGWTGKLRDVVDTG
jgi:hypothetical protein